MICQAQTYAFRYSRDGSRRFHMFQQCCTQIGLESKNETDLRDKSRRAVIKRLPVITFQPVGPSRFAHTPQQHVQTEIERKPLSSRSLAPSFLAFLTQVPTTRRKHVDA